ncbi:cytochrome c family protein [Pseudosulfitobacter sp. DSM 107133]|uniref:c-type cytochrome n=1 Tax=Pseudosulfitobacter sp. DSM 107133 TaxID=2883100 RepID=UPI001F0887F4|nr:cytochrome c family protein [Pseudosulfitobacter sp. DSM 107133]UOA29707.1 Cytochrome c2 [Pseudosulfitobacter sp. DSM 107133]
MRLASPMLIATLLSLVAPIVQAEGNAEKGAKVFRKCKACHAVGALAKTGTGPVLTGVMDAAAMNDPDFQYSDALIKAAQDGLVWDEETLAAFLAKPRDFLRGTQMSFSGLRKESEIEDIIAYLAQQ